MASEQIYGFSIFNIISMMIQEIQLLASSFTLKLSRFIIKLIFKLSTL